jgi:hypothetical protein
MEKGSESGGKQEKKENQKAEISYSSRQKTPLFPLRKKDLEGKKKHQTNSIQI